jgi:3-hydroxyisobutyrate dehydrogenase-like beta-hydroxyacid dehydrogenase
VVTVGLVSPGSMGAAVGACAVAGGTRVLWASEGRSGTSRSRAAEAGLEDAGDLRSLCGTADVLLSICPPHAAVTTAEQVAATGFAGVYVDANAVAPATARAIAELVGPTSRFVDGGIIGSPPTPSNSTRLYLAGSDAALVADLFAAGPLEAIVMAGDPPAASALKVAFAAWTKGSSALLLAVRAYAAAEHMEDDLLQEWSRSLPDLPERTTTTAAWVGPRAWRWAGEMDEIAGAFAAAGLPDGFHRGAAEVCRRLDERKDRPGTTIDEVVSDLLGRPSGD